MQHHRPRPNLKGTIEVSNLRTHESRTAQRFPVNVPVLLKSSGGLEIPCSTRDVSRGGIFLYTENPLPENTSIRFTMRLKTMESSEEGVEVLCSGTVVRVESLHGGDAGMAATIDSYRFLQQKAAHA